MTSLCIDLILVRHGETDANRQRRFQGHVDVALNATGLAQAQRVAARLAEEPRIDGFFTSDLCRARETAAAIAAARPGGLAADALREVPALREQSFGIFDGMGVPDIQLRHPGEWQRWLRFEADHAPPGGESTRAFQARVMAALQRIGACQAPGATVLVVTHGGVLDMVYRTARQLSLDGPRVAEIPNAGINRVRLHASSQEGGPWRPEIRAWGDVAHLEGLPAQAVYDQQKLVREAAQRAQATQATQAAMDGFPGKEPKT